MPIDRDDRVGPAIDAVDAIGSEVDVREVGSHNDVERMKDEG